MSKYSHILGVKFNNVTHLEAVNILEGFLKEEKCHAVFTPNPEIVMAARADKIGRASGRDRVSAVV